MTSFSGNFRLWNRWYQFSSGDAGPAFVETDFVAGTPLDDFFTFADEADRAAEEGREPSVPDPRFVCFDDFRAGSLESEPCPPAFALPADLLGPTVFFSAPESLCCQSERVEL